MKNPNLSKLQQSYSNYQKQNYLLSVITPAYNEEANLPILFEKLSEVLNIMNVQWEWIIIDDHSQDSTFKVISDLMEKNKNIKGIRFARNSGSHIAIICGLDRAQGDCAVVMAADLQDPPESLVPLLAEWKEGNQVIWAVRGNREGEKISTVGFARLYYFLMRNLVGMKEMPASGADFFLLDRVVIDALKEFNETHVSMLALITWMGFRQSYITYDKQARVHGNSGWNLEKKLKLVMDSLTSFSYLPIRFMSYFGVIIAILGFIYAGFIFINGLRGNPIQGWSSLIIVVLVIGGIQMIMMGVLGEYIWRSLDESRRRPRYLIEAFLQNEDQ